MNHERLIFDMIWSCSRTICAAEPLLNCEEHATKKKISVPSTGFIHHQLMSYLVKTATRQTVCGLQAWLHHYFKHQHITQINLQTWSLLINKEGKRLMTCLWKEFTIFWCRWCGHVDRSGPSKTRCVSFVILQKKSKLKTTITWEPWMTSVLHYEGVEAIAFVRAVLTAGLPVFHGTGESP